MKDSSPLEYIDLGLIDYDRALLFQEDLVEKRSLQQIADTILFCSHPPVVTLGRSTQTKDLMGWKGQTVSVSRGGRATYHGPGQKVIYPILDLRKEDRNQMRPKDIMSYLETFEQAVLGALQEMDLKDIHLKEDVSFDEQGRKLLNRGLWVGNKKVVAFGIAVRKWVTYHGCAINIEKEEGSFSGIQPCGYGANAVGYLQDFIDTQDINIDEVLKRHLTKRLG